MRKVRLIAGPILEFSGMELVHLEMRREAGGLILRLFIDKNGGVTLDDCSRISRQLSAQLDLEDPIPQHYTLEVSSPGLDRPLVKESDYSRFAGRRVRLTTLGAVNGQKNFVGRLEGLVEGSVRLVLEGNREVSIALDNVAKARLEIEI